MHFVRLFSELDVYEQKKLWVVCWKVLLDQGSLALGLTVTRRKQVLGVIVVIHSLKGGIKRTLLLRSGFMESTPKALSWLLE